MTFSLQESIILVTVLFFQTNWYYWSIFYAPLTFLIAAYDYRKTVSPHEEKSNSIIWALEQVAQRSCEGSLLEGFKTRLDGTLSNLA